MGTSLGLLLAFFSALAWAGLDVARKSLTADYSAAVIAAGLSGGAAAVFALAVLFTGPQMDVAAYLGPGLISTALGISTQVLILEAVRQSSLSRTVPMLAFTPVATSLFGVLVLGERPTSLEWIGIVIVVFGALALGLSHSDGPESRRERRAAFDRGSALMLMGAISISAAAPFDKLAVGASTPPVHGLVQSLGAALILLGFLAVRGQPGKITDVFRTRPAMTGAVMLAFAAIGLQYLAYSGAMVGEVETIKRVVGSFASLGTGFLIFGERITLIKVVAVGALGAGIALILLGATA